MRRPGAADATCQTMKGRAGRAQQRRFNAAEFTRLASCTLQENSAQAGQQRKHPARGHGATARHGGGTGVVLLRRHSGPGAHKLPTSESRHVKAVLCAVFAARRSHAWTPCRTARLCHRRCHRRLTQTPQVGRSLGLGRLGPRWPTSSLASTQSAALLAHLAAASFQHDAPAAGGCARNCCAASARCRAQRPSRCRVVAASSLGAEAAARRLHLMAWTVLASATRGFAESTVGTAVVPRAAAAHGNSDNTNPVPCGRCALQVREHQPRYGARAVPVCCRARWQAGISTDAP